MKALTVKQPWAGLIVAGVKNIENRTWHTYYSGALAIHASASPDRNAEREMRAMLGVAYPETLCAVTGAIIGVVDLTALVWTAQDGVTETDHPTLTENALAWWNRDCVGFVLENARALKTPLTCKGALGLWTVPADLEQKIER